MRELGLDLAIVRTQIVITGFVLLLVGLACFVWPLARPKEPSWQSAAISNGPLRGSIVEIHLSSERLAFAREVALQGDVIRALREVPSDAFVKTASAGLCPSTFAGAAAATCMNAREIAAYANAVTEMENQFRGSGYSKCYAISTEVRAMPDCTGYRLPHVTEWKAVTNAGSHEGDGVTKQEAAEIVLDGSELFEEDDSRTLTFSTLDGARLRSSDLNRPRYHFRLVRSLS